MPFRLFAAFALVSSGSAGCSIVFDADELPPIVDAAPPIDAIDAAPPIDADPSMLALTGVTPMMIDEAVGSAGRPALFEVSATNLPADAMIDLAWMPDDPGTPIALAEPAAVSSSTGRIGLAIPIPEIDGLAENATKTLRIVVTATGSPRRTIDVLVRGHDPLSLSGAVTSTDARFQQTYSSITVGGATTVTGAMPLRLAAYGSITVDAPITVAAPQAGGCAGGSGGNAASCGDAGGKPGAPGTAVGTGGGGGGGGFGSVGAAASGAGGSMAGNPALVPILAGPNHGSGGGGGGIPTAGQAGLGGHGGGVVYLDAGGAVVVGALGHITADGSPGTAGTGAVVTRGGDGGGGSGGAIWVRAGAPITYPDPTPDTPIAWLSARGADALGNGGAGGDGRIRLDDPGAHLTGTGAPQAVAAPAFDRAGVPAIVRDPALTLTARAAAGCYAISPAPSSPGDVCGNANDRQLDPGGTPITFTLAPGRNTLCVGWTNTVALVSTQTLPEAKNCLDVLYVAP